jgi:magnesium transporter
LLQATVTNFTLREATYRVRIPVGVTYGAVEVLDGHRELVNGLLRLRPSAAGNRTSEVMKVLTGIASIFIPPAFLAGVYGMNFEMAPELQTPWGYPVRPGIMFVLALLMLS